MRGFLSNLLRMLRERDGTDMRFLCRQLLSERGEASQGAIAQEIIAAYSGMNPQQRRAFFDLLERDFSSDDEAIKRAIAAYQQKPSPEAQEALFEAVEPLRQELFRRINTAPHGTETLVALRADLLSSSNDASHHPALDSDLRHLFKSWFNRGFLRLQRISWETSALILENLIRYESVHEINGWRDLRRRLEADRRCFAFFHPALADEPVIFVEVALANGFSGNLEHLLDIEAPVLAPEKADAAIFYSINNCLKGLRQVPFGSFLIKQVVTELAAELPNLKTFATLSPLPRFARALRGTHNEEGFTRERLARLLADFARPLNGAAKRHEVVDSFFHLLDHPHSHRDVLAAPLERLALAYLTKARQKHRLYDPVATFHLTNGARLERVNAFGNLRSYGLEASYGVTANYLYLPGELEENHERFIRRGQIRVSPELLQESKTVAAAWRGPLLTIRRAR